MTNDLNSASPEQLETASHPLNIWWFSHYASTPDQQYTAQFDLAKRLVQKGHRVTFFASGFSHYEFKDIRLSPGEKSREEYIEGVRYVWLKTSPYRVNDWRRALNIVGYSWSAYRYARRLNETPNVIIGTTFHPLASLAAYLTSKSKNAPFIFEVKDLWPLTMVEFGRFSPKSPATLALGSLERFLARRAARITTSLPGVADYYNDLIGIPKNRVAWIPNGLDLSRYQHIKPYTGVIEKNCTLVYAGGHVSNNALHTVLQAAEILQNAGSTTKFVFVGGGQEKPNLVRMSRDMGLKNVEWNDVVPKTELTRFMERADAFILNMRNLDNLYRYGISFNKLCDYVAAGRPVLFAGRVSNNVVEQFQCGLIIPPEDPAAFAEAVQKFESMTPEERRQMGRNGIRCARERFDIEAIVNNLEKVLLSTAERQPPLFRPGLPVPSAVRVPMARE